MEFLYPGARSRALTFSYDDGQIYDRRLVQILNSRGLKGTFHLNTANLDRAEYVTRAELPGLYAGQEVACHGVEHRYPLQLNREQLVAEFWRNRAELETLTGGIVNGMSYAFGEYGDQVADTLRALGIRYSRTVEDTLGFGLPGDFLRWHPTCHHNHELSRMADRFLNPPGFRTLSLFYVWGHSFEFERQNNWQVIEQFADRIANDPDTWYATNGEVCAYISAMRASCSSADGRFLRNEAGVPLWVRSGGQAFELAPGETADFESKPFKNGTII